MLQSAGLLDRYLGNIVGATSTIMGHNLEDVVHPVYTWNGNPPTSSPNVHMQFIQQAKVMLASAAQSPSGKNYAPVTFNRTEERDEFRNKTGVDMPINPDFTNSRNQVVENQYLICGADIVLSLRVDGEDRFSVFKRDMESPHSKGAISGPGGVMDCSPLTAAAQELNQEMGVLVKHEDCYYFLFFNVDNNIGITLNEKQARTERLVERIKAAYGSAVDDLWADKVEILNVNLAPNDLSIPRGHLTVSAPEENLEVTAEGLILYKSAVHSVIYMNSMKLPDAVVIPGTDEAINLQNLEQGKTVFVVDIESPHFNRVVYLLTKEEIRYALDAGMPFMDNTQAFFEAVVADTPAAPSVRVWTKAGFKDYVVDLDPVTGINMFTLSGPKLELPEQSLR